MKSDKVFLQHILDEAVFLVEHTAAISFEQFIKDEILKRACARSLEVIGEAVKNLSPQFRRRHKQAPSEFTGQG